MADESPSAKGAPARAAGMTKAALTLATSAHKLERATERLRQEREAFDQSVSHARRWFNLQLMVGGSSIVILGAVVVVTIIVIFKHKEFDPSVVNLAATTLLVDVLGLMASVWKIVLNPMQITKITPSTGIEDTATRGSE